jgi:T5SS/PEP-CTERM-associated repeat protein
MRKRALRSLTLGATALTAVGIAPALAANPQWNGTTSGDWFDAGNWSPSAVPTAADTVTVDTNGTPNSATIDGGTANTAAIFIGASANGDLTLKNGAILNSTSGSMGFGATGSANINVIGAGTAWNISGDLSVGRASINFTALYFGVGGVVSDVNATVGDLAGAGGAVGVADVGSSWINSGNLIVGNAGTGSLLVWKGATASAANTTFGALHGGSGSLNLQDDNNDGTVFYAGTTFNLGLSGSGTITASGGSINSTNAYLGVNSDGTGNATIDFSSVWNNTGNINVGHAGTGSLSILNGGTVNSGLAVNLGFASTGVGTLTVDGTGSTLAIASNANLVVGVDGAGSAIIRNGGTVTGLGGVIGQNQFSNGNVTVDGAGSAWTNTGTVTVGYGGHGTLLISNSGHVIASATTVGGVFGAPTGVGSILVDGAGSILDAGGFVVGGFGTGQLYIHNAGTVNGDSGIISAGAQVTPSSPGGTVLIDGPGSSLNMQGDLTVGSGAGSWGNLQVVNAGVAAISGAVTIASQAGSRGEIDIGGNSGESAIAPGTLNVASVQFGAGTGSILFNHTGVGYAFTPSIAGVGTINQMAGETILSADSSGFTGVANVSGGRLAVNGSLANATVTVTGGVLGGNGVVGNTTIAGGTLAPGNSIGTLTVHGSLTFTAASTYMVEVSPANADRTNVTGMATLGGATVNALFAPGSYVSKQYTIVNAGGGVSGSFASLVNTNLPANFASSLSYDANNVYLNLTMGAGFAGLNQNQARVSAALTNAFNSAGGIPGAFVGLSPAGLTQVSGELGTATQQTTFDAMNLFMGLMTDPANRGDGATSSQSLQFANASDGKPRSGAERDAYAAIDRKGPVADSFSQRWNVWAAGYGGSQTTDGNAATGSNTTTSRVYGVAAGADYLFSPTTIAGFSMAGGGTNFSVANGGSGRSDLFQAGAFVRHSVGSAYVTAAAAYGWQDITTNRNVTVAGSDQLRARFTANAYSGRVEIGNRYGMAWMGGIGLTPYAAAQVTAFDLPGYAESAIAGTSTYALAYAAKTATDTRSELGLRSDKSFAVDDGVLTLRGRAAWAHDYMTDRSVATTFQTLPGASFVVNGAAQAPNAALTTVSAEMNWMNGWSAKATFEGEFSSVTASYAGKAVLRYAW